MTTAMDALLQRLEAQREVRVEVEPRKVIVFRRPAATHLHHWAVDLTPERAVQQCAALALRWEGITEADLLGADQGGDQPARFTPEVLAFVLEDRPAWLELSIAVLVDALTERIKAVVQLRKNSPPSSSTTTPTANSGRAAPNRPSAASTTRPRSRSGI